MGTGDTFINPREGNARWSGQSQEQTSGCLGSRGDTTFVWDGDKGQRLESLLEEESLISESPRKTGAECPEIGDQGTEL